MDSNEFQIEVLERLTAIETTLKQIDYKSIEDKTDKLKEKVVVLDNKINNDENRLDKIEDNNRWLWRTVAGAIILAVLGLIFKI